MADVINAVLEDGDPLRAHAEGETAEALRVVAAVAQHHRMNHAGAHDLQPARPLAHAAPLAAADDAIHVHLDARLGEREVAGADANPPFLAEQPAGEGADRALEVGHRDPVADSQALDLVEHDLATGGDRLIAVAHARQDD